MWLYSFNRYKNIVVIHYTYTIIQRLLSVSIAIFMLLLAALSSQYVFSNVNITDFNTEKQNPEYNSQSTFPLTTQALNDTHIQWAIDCIVEQLYALRNEGGNWDRIYPDSSMHNFNAHITGQSTLATLALLSAGQSYQDPRLLPAIDYLRTQNPDYTYVRSLRCHIWAMLPNRFTPVLDDDLRWLIRTYGYESGSWGYSIAPIKSGYDNSLTQYGTLGLWEAAKRGLNVPDKLWQRLENHYLRTQLSEGGWNYRPTDSPRASMTAAGLVCLFITQDYLHAGEHLEPNSRKTKAEEAIEKGLQWLSQNFSADFHPGAPGANQQAYYFYYLYGVERVGLASGMKHFGEHDWFREGAVSIINKLCEPVNDAQGNITGYKITANLPDTGNVEVPIVQLSFALMFLSHGRAPIILTKLSDENYSWNNRPRDIANLTRWINDETEKPASWQIISVNDSLNQWLDSPILYIASHEALPYAGQHDQSYEKLDEKRRWLQKQNQENPVQNLNNPDNTNDYTQLTYPTTLEKIKRYLDLGGMLLTNADVHNKHFSDSVELMACKMYPNAIWRKLPEDHLVYKMSKPLNKPPDLYGLTNGVRELIIHCPRADVGATLQINDRKAGQSDIFNVLSNIYYYASERTISKPRLANKLIIDASQYPYPYPYINIKPDIVTQSQIPDSNYTILRGKYDGNWNPEPAADELLIQQFKNRNYKNLNLAYKDINLENLIDYDIAHQPTLLWLRGTAAYNFTPEQIQGINSYSKKGGVMLIETVGGCGDFTKAMEATIQSLYPENKFRQLTRHPIITGSNLENGVDCSRVAYRLYSYEQLAGRQTKPRLRAMSFTVDNPDGDNNNSSTTEIHIITSREDITNALLDQPCWGISGYTNKDAVALMGNIITYTKTTASVAKK